MYDRISIKEKAKKKVNLNLGGLVIIPVMAWSIKNILIPAIAGVSLANLFSYFLYDDLSYVLSHMTSPFRLTLAGLLSYVILTILEYWQIHYEMAIHINDGRKFKPWDIMEDMNLEGIISYVIKTVVATAIASLWGLLLIVPGILKSFSYAMVPYIAIEHPEMGIFETLRESEKMMYGHRMDLFVLNISFILWQILSNFTMGILNLYVNPYIGLSHIGFYYNLKGYDDSHIDVNIYNAQDPDIIDML